MKDQCHENDLFAIDRDRNNKDLFALGILNIQKEKEKYSIKLNTKIRTYISYQGFSYSKKALDDVMIICYDSKIYVPQSIHRRLLDWYHSYLNLPGGSRLEKKIGRYATGKDL